MSAPRPPGEGGAVVVECYAGYRGEETPRRLLFDDGRIEEVEVVRRWLTPDERGFELRGASGARYLVLHGVTTHAWRRASRPPSRNAGGLPSGKRPR